MDVFYEVRLQKLALVSSALSFWRKDDIQLKLKQFYQPLSRLDEKEFLIILIEEVMKKVNSDSLPSVLYSELLLAIKEMGFKMSDWFYYIRRRKVFRNIRREELYDKFLKDVYFTYYGTIDEMKILKLSWMTVPDVDCGILYIMACYYCAEELISDIWRNISDQQLQFYTYEHLCKRLGFHLVAYWNKLREYDLEGFFNDCIVPFTGGYRSVYDTAQSVEVNMFRLSVREGYVRGVKYFGNKLSTEEIERNVEDCLTVVLDTSYKTCESQFFRHEQFTEIAFYLSNFLTDSTKEDIFIHNDLRNNLGNFDTGSNLESLLNMFIKMWPWQKCFKIVFKLVEKFIDKEQYSSIIFFVIHTMEKNFNLGVTSQGSVSQSQLHQLWCSISTEWKFFICEELHINPLLRCDMTSAKLILYDKQFAGKMEGAIKSFIEDCFRLCYPRKNEDKTKILQEFILTVLIPPEWDDNLQDVVRSLYAYVMDGDVDSINELLYNSPKNLIKVIKEKIRHEPVCYYLLKKQEYDVCEQFLNWKFHKESDIVSYKKTFYDDRFTIDHVLDVWMSYKENVEMAKIKSDEFLSWFLCSELKKMQFKIERLGGQMIDSLGHFNISFFNKRFEVLNMEDFFDYCCLNKVAFQLTKELIANQYLKYMIVDYMKHNLVEKADKLFKWAFSDAENEKTALMHRIWTDRGLRLRSHSKNTTEGIVSCKLYIGKYLHRDVFSPRPTREEVTENFKKFIRFFVKPYLEHPDKLKHALKVWPDISKRFLEEIDEDERSTATCYSEWPESDDDEIYIYCEREYCEWFLEILEKEIPSV